MTDEVESLVLEQLRLIRKSQEEMREDILDIKIRLSATERHLGELQLQVAALNSRMDRFDERMARVERRLGLVDA
jgi:predicted  nucleic acid-binding Zn-ribbon protein